MRIAYKLGNMGWAEDRITTLDNIFSTKDWPAVVYIIRNQEDYDILRGYELVYGIKLPLVLQGSEPRPFNINEVFLWVDFPVKET